MEMYITSRQVEDDAGAQRRFAYFLTVDEVSSGSFCCENYGVRITEEGAHSVCIPGLTTSAVRIDQLMTALVDNTVGPVGLQDVIDDWL